ncbi:MAG: hypothetical protein LBR92_04280 [Puniceicoccales bacterium]|jgi:hypothetical protein|nr:hypothetical protein [Puniceicoccales bacterium]
MGTVDTDRESSLERALIMDPHVYISSTDRYASPVSGESIARYLSLIDNPDSSVPNPIGVTSNFLTDGDGEVLSYCLIGGLSDNIYLETTPIAFTRGLKENGLWDEKAGLYGFRGGICGFCGWTCNMV